VDVKKVEKLTRKIGVGVSLIFLIFVELAIPYLKEEESSELKKLLRELVRE
jgi:hypothetical protein